MKMGNEFTCLRCAIVMNFAGIESINFWNEDKLVSIKPEDAVRQATDYALGKKTWIARTELVFEGEVHQLKTIEVEFPKVDMSKELRFPPQSDSD